jgi:hypothetical protein
MDVTAIAGAIRAPVSSRPSSQRSCLAFDRVRSVGTASRRFVSSTICAHELSVCTVDLFHGATTFHESTGCCRGLHDVMESNWPTTRILSTGARSTRTRTGKRHVWYSHAWGTVRCGGTSLGPWFTSGARSARSGKPSIASTAATATASLEPRTAANLCDWIQHHSSNVPHSSNVSLGTLGKNCVRELL